MKTTLAELGQRIQQYTVATFAAIVMLTLVISMLAYICLAIRAVIFFFS